MCRVLACVLVCILMILPTFASAGDKPEKEEPKEPSKNQTPAISDNMVTLFYNLWARYSEAMEGGNADKVTDHFTESAVLMEHGREDIVGKEAIRKFTTEMFATTRITDNTVTQGATTVCGDVIYQFGTFHQSLQIQDKDPFGYNGRYFSVWERQKDGYWKISRLMLNSTEPLR